MPFGWGESKDAHDEVYGNADGEPREGKFSHELLAGAASFEAFKLFEDKQRKDGQPVSHAFAKELLAGIAGGEVDKLAETKGMNFVDKERAQHAAKKNAEKMYDEHYGSQGDQYDPNTMQPNDKLQGYGNW